MFLIPRMYTYVGIDETCLSIGNGGLIVVGAITTNSSLAQCHGYRGLCKSKDVLRNAKALSNSGDVDLTKIPPFPPYEEMRSCGLDTFRWMRSRYGGRFSRQEIEHASIAHLVANLKIDHSHSILMIDAFHGKSHETVDIICGYLERQGITFPRSQIQCHGEGDRSVPIINYADLLAFQIGLHLNLRYRQFVSDALDFEVLPRQIPYDEHRVTAPIDSANRDILENLWARKTLKR